MRGSFYKLLSVLAFLLFHLGLNAQISDDFSDGEFTSNPSWSGESADFIVDNEQLRLNASATGESYISTQALWKDTVSWACWFKMDFSPSTSNKLRIYLSFDRADLSSSGNGYFLEIGESGSVDNLELYRQSGSTVSLLAQGTESTLGGEPNECRILVTRSSTGKFQVNADFTGGTNLSLDFEATDQTFSEGEYFGFLCDYTSTRADKFYFDDIRIDPIFKDTKAPELLGLEVLDPNNLELTFSEVLDSTSAVANRNYDLNGTEPSRITWNSSSADKVQLEFANPLVSGTNYTLKASGIKDLADNELTNGQKSFFYYLPTAGDLIINEVFPDPTPSQGLPEYEFVELFNTTSNDIQLANWTISDASSTTSFDSVVLKAGEYLIVCPIAAVANYSAYGNVMGVSLPALNNGGDDVVLKAANGTLIDKISYDSDWYNDPLRSAGGFSIERINQITKCSGPNNWKASQDDNGGTPGAANSVLDNSPDVTAPILLEAISTDGTNFKLLFDEPVDSTSAVNASYNVSGVGAATSVRFSANTPQEVQIELANTVDANTFYDIEINGVEDCEGNTLNQTFTDAILYMVAVSAELHDVLITEIMADPEPIYDLPNAEFLELTNASDKVINIGNLKIKAGKDIAELDSFVLFPGEIITICKSTEAYLFESFGKAMGVSGFPSLSNGGELLELRKDDGELIHFVDYKDTWYGNELKEDGGYTLEMIDLTNPCGEANNWKGAKGNAYGTPGKSNSVVDENPDLDNPFIEKAIAIDSSLVEITFNEVCDSASLSAEFNYLSVQSIFRVEEVLPIELPFKSVRLKLDNPVAANNFYKLEISGIEDCAQNELKTEAEFVLPDRLDSFDVVINEVLFNPESGGVDFVEIYNRSGKQLNLSDLFIANRNDDGELTSVAPLSETDFIFSDYVAFTEDREDILERYTVWEPALLLEANLPSMPDNEGEVVLLTADSAVIDELLYSAGWHYPLLEDDDGYSLERISPDHETQNEGNWATCGNDRATPARKNSHFNTSNLDSAAIELSGESFSPDNDGFEDKLQIKIRSGSNNQSVSIKIFDLGGRMTRNLVGHDVLGSESLFAWDGFDDNGQKAPVGVYVLLIEIINLDTGRAESHKESVVLKGRL
jgi:hypothetical protein